MGSTLEDDRTLLLSRKDARKDVRRDIDGQDALGNCRSQPLPGLLWRGIQRGDAPRTFNSRRGPKSKVAEIGTSREPAEAFAGTGRSPARGASLFSAQPELAPWGVRRLHSRNR